MRQSHGREEGLSIRSLLENGGTTGKVTGEEHRVARVEEQRRAVKNITFGRAFL